MKGSLLDERVILDKWDGGRLHLVHAASSPRMARLRSDLIENVCAEYLQMQYPAALGVIAVFPPFVFNKGGSALERNHT